MHVIRRVIYRLGYRPKPPSIFYSPSLSVAHAYRDILRTIRATERGER